MSLTFLLAPIPYWVILKANGTAAGGAYLYTKRALNPTEDKAVFKDPGGQVPWTNPIIFDANGVQGPFYWEVNDGALNDTYFLQAYDGDKDNGGTLLWEINNYAPPGGGGGSVITNVISATNYINNSLLIDHIDDITGTEGPNKDSLPINLVIAPSNHKGFTPALINPTYAAPYGALGPDIRFIKAGSSPQTNTDNITFTEFPLGSTDFTGDVTPVDYITYTCTTSNGGEDYKYFQFPITQKVQNLAGQTMTFSFWAKVASGTSTVTVGTLQYFGYTVGTGASSPVLSPLQPRALTTSWAPYNVTVTVPIVGTKTLGLTPAQQTNDDALYFVLMMPINEPCEISFAKPALYLGDVVPKEQFQTYDQINSIAASTRTGDIKVTYVSDPSATQPVLNGWVAMNDGSIGNPDSNATTRANKDTFQLYKTIWDSVSNQWAPVQDSTGVFLISRGASAQADFLANHRLVLPRALGRALAGAGAGAGLTSRALGEYLGSEVITINAMPAHNHPGSTVPFSRVAAEVPYQGSSPPVNPVNTNASSVTVAAQGGGTLNVQGAADGNMEPTTYMQVYIKL